MKTKNIVIAGLAVVVMVAVYVWFFVYNKAHTDYQNVEAAFVGDAVSFYNEATTASFADIYLNKAVEISGEVSSIESQRAIMITPGLLCEADSTTNFEGIEIGSTITLKGRAVGTDEDLLTGDVLIRLDQCVIQ